MSCVAIAVAAVLGGCAGSQAPSAQEAMSESQPYVILLGSAQDAGSPQVNSPADHPARLDPAKRRYAVCLGIVDPRSGKRWLIDATPDFREQAWLLSRSMPESDQPIQLDGIFLTHAHMGHYTGLMFVGHESMGARNLPVYAMPRMSQFLSTNGPWDQLVRYENINLMPLADGIAVELAEGLSITPFLVPHRQEYAEVVGFRVDGPQRSVLFLPDIDSWDEWADLGTQLRDVLDTVDVAYLDGTFYDNNEIPGRDMTTFPHPRILQTMDRLSYLPLTDRSKVRFIHLNHTNPAQWEGTPQRREVNRRGFRVGQRGERVGL